MERWFAVVEANPYDPWTEVYMDKLITETELIRRLKWAAAFIDLDTYKAIEFLLKGTITKYEGVPVTRAEAIDISNKTLAKAEAERRLCRFYPRPDDDKHGGVCYANSELGKEPCTEYDEQHCPYAEDILEALR